MINLKNDDNNSKIPDKQKSQLINRLVQTIVDFVVIAIIFSIFLIVYYKVEPKIQYFTCDESDIFMPYKDDTIPFWAVVLYATIGPIIFIIIIELINAKIQPFRKNSKEKLKKFLICFLHGLSLFVLGIVITLLLTEIGKRWVGRLRPHFIDVCKPDLTLIECSISTMKGQVFKPINTGDTFCTVDKKIVERARKSFPSGHSSYSWYSMTFLIIYLEARLFLLRLRFIKPLIQMTAFIAAFITAMSRISDYHHRESDVIGGIMLGVVIALAITLFIGRVIWDYEIEKPYADFDLKPLVKDTDSFE
ncbi:unnamed protein product [Brachionus calyciflorus]|uniref:Phosphatidic acid phosphatase type 2/haloperoxidase domain-containing protein n=1 Tax=Brachionus calyciflorus TaxID=104777 RepID=A0A813WN22_9BILA|nr:unnamed protein product [Brachionus calyciflorus]